ncbi:nuclear transport factor 2 family protein [Shewanella intestini]|nr:MULTISPECIES: nuclear transport factor 2 family protein [Shewanella]
MQSSVNLSSLASVSPSKTSEGEQGLPQVLQRFSELYQHLNSDNLHLLGSLYRDDICFIDPLHQINGINDLTQYFAGMYANIISINFTIAQIAVIDHRYHNKEEQGADKHLPPNAQQAHVFWTMHYQHPKLNEGQVISVDGMSQLFYTDKIYRHRDYFDAGAMLYEQLPLFGRVIRYVKNRIAIS